MLVSRVAFFHSTKATLSGKTSPLFKLRQRTGLAYNLCREALNKHENNVEEAEAWLKAEALTHGLQKATKVSGRSTRQGLIGIAVQPNNKVTTVVELNCETDFVSRNQVFKDLVIDLTGQFSATSADCVNFNIPGQQHINELKPSESQLKGMENQIAPLITKLGENIKIARALHLRVANESSAKLFGQIHSQAARKTTNQHDIIAGRFAGIVGLKLSNESSDAESIKSHGNRLCQHVIGYNPSYIELPENIRKHLEEAEKNQLERKPDEDCSDTQHSDHEGFQSNHDSRDDWPSIMDQTLIMSEDMSVRDFCLGNGITIIYFNRLECGVES